MSPTACLVAAMAWCALAACAPPGPGVRGSDVDAAGDPPAPAHVVTAVPRAYVLPLEADTRRCLLERLERGDLRIARLTLAGLRPRNAQALKGVRLFIQQPDTPRSAAQAVPAPGDPHAAGAFALGLEAEQTYVLNIAPTLSALWRNRTLDAEVLSANGNGLRMTFVADPWEDAGALPQDFALPIDDLHLDVPCEPRQPRR